MEYIVVIPARYGSSRLLGKPLIRIAGKPMIQRVYEQCLLSDASRVVVATDDARIAETVAGFGGECCMTSADRQSGTDRIFEVAQQLALPDEAILVNVQGDEPMIPPAVIRQVAQNLADNPAAGVATLDEPLGDIEAFRNPNVVKSVCGRDGLALYYSRAPIPWPRDEFAADPDALPAGFPARRHIGIYAYRVILLRQFVNWPVAPLEKIEKLEQLRFMWNGVRIHSALAVEFVPGGVDTAEDLRRVEAAISAQVEHHGE